MIKTRYAYLHTYIYIYIPYHSFVRLYIIFMINDTLLGSYHVQKREKRRWVFRRAVAHLDQQSTSAITVANTESPPTVNGNNSVLTTEERHAIAVAAATAAAAEAAAVTAQAAVEIVRLSRPSNFVKQHYAATVIQTAFRGYLVPATFCVLSYFEAKELSFFF